MSVPCLRVAVASAVLAAVGGVLSGACAAVEQPPPAQVPDGDPQRGPALITQYGCASCHVVPGVREAEGYVGPPLTEFARRSYIAGVLPNTGDNLQRWIRDPQQIVPGNAMPDMGVTEQDARDLAAYLFTLR